MFDELGERINYAFDGLEMLWGSIGKPQSKTAQAWSDIFTYLLLTKGLMALSTDAILLVLIISDHDIYVEKKRRYAKVSL